LLTALLKPIKSQAQHSEPKPKLKSPRPHLQKLTLPALISRSNIAHSKGIAVQEEPSM